MTSFIQQKKKDDHLTTFETLAMVIGGQQHHSTNLEDIYIIDLILTSTITKQVSLVPTSRL